MFTPVPEVLGLGAKVPTDLKYGDVKRQKMSSNDLLRRQLLGKDHARLQNKGDHGQGGQRIVERSLVIGSKPRPIPVKRKGESESSGDEGGRSSLGKKKRKKWVEIVDSEEMEGADADMVKDEESPRELVKKEKKANNYLDEVLSQKKEKKPKKKKKRKMDRVSEAV
ncbi:MAG: hypothetical protein Q9224_002252 [Gallowayella concinna]